MNKPNYNLLRAANQLAITTGLCLPSACSIKVFERIINEILASKKVLYAIPESTCQFEEDASDVRTLDYVTM